MQLKIIYSQTTADASSEVLSRSRESRQQGGDTYTLEIAFPAVKYVPILSSLELFFCFFFRLIFSFYLFWTYFGVFVCLGFYFL